MNSGPTPFVASLELIAKRSLAHWRLLSAVVIGVLLAGGIMATSVMYFESLRDVALQHALSRYEPDRLDILIEARDAPLNRERSSAISGIVEGTVVRRLSPFLKDFSTGLKTWTFFVGDGRDLSELTALCDCAGTALSGPTETLQIPGPDGEVTKLCDCRRAFFGTFQGLEDHAALLEGRHPAPSPPAEPGEKLRVEVLVPGTTAQVFGLGVGSEFRVVPHWEDANEDVFAVVTGVYERDDPDSTFWRAYDQAFGTISASLVFAELMVPEATLLDAISPHLPRMGAEYYWRLDTDTERMDAASTASIRRSMEAVEAEMRAEVDGYRQQTDLPNALAGFDTDLFYNRLPMFIVLILIVVVVLYYVLTLASLLVDTQRDEISLLRGRGATSAQILAVFAVEATVLAVLAIALGPLIAAGAVKAIGAAPWFQNLGPGVALSVRLSAAGYQMAAIGGALSFLALFVPASRAARVGVIGRRRMTARPARLPAFQRYYLDVGFLALVVFLFWQLSKQGSFVAVRLFGEQAVDQLVLAVPAMFLVAAALVVLRVFPVSMDLLGRALSGRYLYGLVPPAFVLGLWQMARNPSHYARLSLLLILTAGLGVFAASFSATLDRSSKDRLMYESGADVRVTGIRPPTEGISGTGLEQVRDVEGVGFATPVLRWSGWSESGVGDARFDLLAVRPDEFEEVGWCRPDLARGGLGRVLGQISVSPQEGLPLPEDAHWLTVRVRPFVARSDVWVVARLEDSLGRFYTLPLGSLHPMSVDRNRFPCVVPEDDKPARPDWCRLGGSLMPPRIRGISRLLPRTPVVLHSVGIVSLSGALGPGAIEIDDISVVDRLGENLLVMETFDDPGRWQVLVNSANAQGDAFTGAIDVGGGKIPGVARFSWTQGSARGLRGFTMDDARAPLDAVVSPSFLASVGASVGDEVPVSVPGGSFSVRVTGTAGYFPTLDPNARPFILMDLQALVDRLNLGQMVGDMQWNELWIRLADTVEGEAAGTAPSAPTISDKALAKALTGSRVMFSRIIEQGPMLADAETDPLVAAGWRALLAVAFGTVLAVSAIGFFVHARVSFEARLGEFALLRTIGLSMRQLLALVVLEQILVIGTAVGLGIFMGMRLGATIMPYLASSGAGVRVAPPMLTEVDWAGFCVTFGVVAAVFALVVTAILVYVYRMAIHRVMRLGER